MFLCSNVLSGHFDTHVKLIRSGHLELTARLSYYLSLALLFAPQFLHMSHLPRRTRTRALSDVFRKHNRIYLNGKHICYG